MTAEIKERLSDELDYEHEAQSQRAIARAWRGHPFVVIPDVVTSLSREKVLVTEWAEGVGFEEVRELSEEEQDRFAEIFFRFYFGSLYRVGFFSGDPHPGNCRLLPDGRVAFLDFGMTKKMPPDFMEAEVDAFRKAMDGDVQGLYERMGAMGYYDLDDPAVTAEAVYAHFRDATSWYIDDEEVTLDRKVVAQVLVDFGDPRSPHWDLMKRETVPPEAMLARRMEALTLGVLGNLGVTGNWHRIAREWLFGDPPSTPLGEQEAEFFGRQATAA
jgi:predicted unusual protein kinase regulating ubiquinone biosynthesis (AarF/ABC1/UbiB family)